MIEEKCELFNDGQRIAGSFYLPDGRGDTGASGRLRPVVIACSGFMGLNDIHPARFARALTARGYTCFGFDYRGFGPSEGRAGSITLDAEVQDMACAISYVQNDARAKGAPIVMLGWGMGAGQILQVGHLPRVRALVCINGFYNGRRVQQALRGPEGFEKFVGWVEEKRAQSVRSRDALRLEPFDIYPLDPVTVGYVDDTLRKNPGFRGLFDISLADALMRWAPEGNLGALQDRPILIAHGERNELHPVAEAESLYALYPGPKELYWIKGGGHTEWMFDDHPLFVDLAAKIASWLDAL